MIIVEPQWNPQTERQAEDRIYRKGQTEDVIIYKLLADDTAESRMESTKFWKTNMANLVDSKSMKNIGEGQQSISDKDIEMGDLEYVLLGK